MVKRVKDSDEGHTTQACADQCCSKRKQAKITTLFTAMLAASAVPEDVSEQLAIEQEECLTEEPPVMVVKKKQIPKRCEHNKILCKTCHAHRLCEHLQTKNRCPRCAVNNPNFKKRERGCEHKSEKTRCQICSPWRFCEHAREKTRCVECGVRTYACEHQPRRSTCRICNPKAYCQHLRLRSMCQQCHPTLLCEHFLWRRDCAQCGNRKRCEHGVIKDMCFFCGNVACIHRIRKVYCVKCDGSRLCAGCKAIVIIKKGQYCTYCKPAPGRHARVKEAKVAAYLKEWSDTGTIQPWTTWNKELTNVNKADCGRPRPDFLYDCGSRVVVVECDEDQHKLYPKRCEFMRLARIVDGFRTEAGACIPVHVIRFNPDTVKVNSETTTVKTKARMLLLQERLIAALASTQTEHRVVVEKLFYDIEGPDAKATDVQEQLFETLAEFEDWIDATHPLESVGASSSA